MLPESFVLFIIIFILQRSIERKFACPCVVQFVSASCFEFTGKMEF